MADDLPDAPWVTQSPQSSANLPDAPWITPEARQASRIEKYLPEQQKVASQESAFKAAMPSTLGDIPGFGPWMEKGYAQYKAGQSGQEKYGATPEERYANILAENEAYRQARGKAHPIASYGPGIIGGVGTALAAAAALPAEVVAAPALGLTGLAGALTSAATTGAGIGALQGAGESAPGASASQMAKNALVGGAGGAAAGPIGYGAGKVIGSAIAPVGRALESAFSPKTGATRDLAAAATSATQKGAPGLSLAEAESLRVAGQPVQPTQIAGIQQAAQQAANRAPQSEAIGNINRALQENLEGRKVQFASSIDNIGNNTFGKPVDAIAVREAAQEVAQKQFDPLYKKAFGDLSAQSVWLPEGQAILKSSFGNEAVENTVKFLQNKEAQLAAREGRNSRVIENPLEKNPDTGFYDLPIIPMEDGSIARGAPPNLEFWDAMKRMLSDQYQRLSNQTSDLKSRTFAAQVGDANKNLTNALTARFQPYKEALDFGKRYFGESNAFDAGLNFFKQASGATRVDPQQWSQYLKNATKYTPQETENFQMGLLQSLKDDPNAVSRAFIDKTGAGQLTRENLAKVEKLVPPQMAQDISNSAQMMNISAMNKYLMGQQAAAPGSAHLGAWGVAGALGSAAVEHLAPGAIKAMAADPVAIATAALAGTAWGTKKAITSFANAMERRRAETLLNMLDSNDPKIIQQIQEAARTDANFKKVLDSMERGFAAAVASNRQAEETGARGIQAVTGLPVARKAGGRVTKMTAEQRAEKLLRMADLAKKHVNKTTEQILSAPDETVARALKIAQAHI